MLLLLPCTHRRLISEDPEYGLWTVTIFRKFADDFRNAAREKKCVCPGSSAPPLLSLAFSSAPGPPDRNLSLSPRVRFIVREYEFDAEEVEADEEERHKLKQDLSKKYVRLT